jgi:putative MATE family efflux protein
MSAPKRSEILGSNTVHLMFRIGWPVMLASLLETFYQLADMFWLGRLGGEESGDSVAALQIAFPLLWFFASAVAGFAMSGTALVSQHTGAGNSKNADIAATQIISFSIVAGIIVAIIGSAVAPFLIPLITGTGRISELSTSYLLWFFPCMPFVFINASFRILSSAAGDTKTPLKITLITNIINVILDPFLIVGIGPFPRMGVAGAAAATLLSTALASIAVLYIMLRKKNVLKLLLNHLLPEKKWVKQIFKIGFPAAVGHSAESLGFIVLMTVIAKLPESRDALAGYGIVNRLTSFIFIPAQGLGQGLSTIIGQNLGACNFDRAKKCAMEGIKIISGIIALQIALVMPFREALIGIFIPGDAGVIEEGSRFLLIFGISMPLFGVVRGATSAFNAAGRNLPAMIIGFARLWLFRIPFAIIGGFVLGLGSSGVWGGMALSNFLAAFVAIYLFKKGKWLVNITCED